ncbi:ParA family protein [Candidatus Enterovibrio escicola]|nr:ParA family protein [Candidatus Enterovibrio escacola]
MSIVSLFLGELNMKIVAIWNPKGGQGKTTISLNLAAAASKLGLKTVVISRDIQDDEAMKEFGRGSYPFDIYQGVPRDKPDADLIIIDHPAGDRNAPETTKVICPIVPCKLDYRTYSQSKHVLTDSGKEIIEVCSRGDMRVRDEREFIRLMRKQGASSVRRRSTFVNAHNTNKTIFDKSFDRVGKIGEPRAEIEGLLARALS